MYLCILCCIFKVLWPSEIRCSDLHTIVLNRMHVAQSRSNLKIHYKLLFTEQWVLCCILSAGSVWCCWEQTRQALQSLSSFSLPNLFLTLDSQSMTMSQNYFFSSRKKRLNVKLQYRLCKACLGFLLPNLFLSLDSLCSQLISNGVHLHIHLVNPSSPCSKSLWVFWFSSSSESKDARRGVCALQST